MLVMGYLDIGEEAQSQQNCSSSSERHRHQGHGALATWVISMSQEAWEEKRGHSVTVVTAMLCLRVLCEHEVPVLLDT